jgi:hypothetical protein
MRDPVGDGLVAGLAHPGGNVTGITNFATDLYGKHLELLREVIPTLSRIGVLFDRNDQSAAASYRVVEAAATTLGVELRSLVVSAPGELASAFDVAISEKVDALMTLGRSMIVNQQARTVELAARHRLPAIYGTREAAHAGGLMAYGANIRDQFRRAASYVDKILKGAKPADLPKEIELHTFRAFAGRDLLNEAALGRMLAGLSTRPYPVGLEPVGDVEPLATSKSSISRRFVQGTEVLGVDADGRKHPLGLWEGTTENKTVCNALLGNRGAAPTRSRRAWPGRGARHPSSRSFWWTSAAGAIIHLLEFLVPQDHDVELVDKERPAAVAAAEVG